MAITPTWASAGGAETQDLSTYSASTAGATISSNGYFTGPNELRLNNNAGTASVTTPSLTLTGAGSRMSFRYRFDALPGTEGAVIETYNGASGGTYILALFADGTLHLRPAADNANLATGSTVLAINTVYEIVVAHTITSTTVFMIKVWINGNLEMTATNSGTLGFASPDRFRFVITSSGGGGPAANSNAWFGDQWADEDSSLTYPGATRATAKRPVANGTTNGMTGTGGGSGYGTGNAPYVNERPLSQTSYVSVVGAGSVVTEEYNIEGASVGDVDVSHDTVVGLVGWAVASSGTGENASLILKNATSNATLSSTPTFFRHGITASSYLPGTGTDIGLKTTTAVTTVTLYECGVIVLFQVSAATPISRGMLF